MLRPSRSRPHHSDNPSPPTPILTHTPPRRIVTEERETDRERRGQLIQTLLRKYQHQKSTTEQAEHESPGLCIARLDCQINEKTLSAPLKVVDRGGLPSMF